MCSVVAQNSKIVKLHMYYCTIVQVNNYTIVELLSCYLVNLLNVIVKFEAGGKLYEKN
jgi:hypothetical protein